MSECALEVENVSAAITVQLLFVLLAELLSGPTDVNVSLGSVAEFHCSGKGFEVIWLVNQISTFNIESPFISTSDTKDDRTINAVLSITGVHEMNNSQIQCYVHDTSSNSNISPVVLLMVQGIYKKNMRIFTIHYV